MRIFIYQLLIVLLIIPFSAFAKKDKNIKYEYKKHESFDFNTLDVSGNLGSPGDLSISPRFRKRFKNKIPERKNFKREMKTALDSVR